MVLQLSKWSAKRNALKIVCQMITESLKFRIQQFSYFFKVFGFDVIFWYFLDFHSCYLFSFFGRNKQSISYEFLSIWLNKQCHFVLANSSQHWMGYSTCVSEVSGCCYSAEGEDGEKWNLIQQFRCHKELSDWTLKVWTGQKNLSPKKGRKGRGGLDFRLEVV